MVHVVQSSLRFKYLRICNLTRFVIIHANGRKTTSKSNWETHWIEARIADKFRLLYVMVSSRCESLLDALQGRIKICVCDEGEGFVALVSFLFQPFFILIPSLLLLSYFFCHCVWLSWWLWEIGSVYDQLREWNRENLSVIGEVESDPTMNR